MTTDAPAINAQTAIARYTPLEASIAEFLAKHENVVHDVTTTAGMAAAKQDRAECRRLRTAVESARVEEKADALAYGRKVDAEAKRITAIIEPAEESYDAQIKVEEARKEREKQARIEAERQRVAAIRAAIDGFKTRAAGALTMTTEEARAALLELVADDPLAMNETGEPFYAEFADEAIATHAGALDFLRELVAKKERQDEEAAALATERAALEAQRAELDAREAAERTAREAREAEERAAAKEREKAERAEREAAQEREREALAEERAALARERAELDAQRADQARADAAEREARMLEEAEAAERERVKREEERQAAAEKAHKEYREQIAAERAQAIAAAGELFPKPMDAWAAVLRLSVIDLERMPDVADLVARLDRINIIAEAALLPKVKK